MKSNNIINKEISLIDSENVFINDIRTIVSTAKEHTYKTANLAIVVSNWLLGRRIVVQEQNGKERAEYGKHIIEIASVALTKTFGKGYGESTLRNYRKFYQKFKNLSIQQPLLAVFEKPFPTIYQAKYLTFLPDKDELAKEIEKQKEIFRLQHMK